MQINGQNNDNMKSKRLSRMILLFIVLVFITIIGIMCAIIYLQGNVTKTYIDGIAVNLPEGTIIKEGTGKIYVDIKAIAKYLGYDAHNGEYKLYTEDTNKCYVDSKKETASFFLNSNKISKMPPDQTKDYEDYAIADPVISRNGKLYCTIDGIKIGFNVDFQYSEKGNVSIFTLPYLVGYYTNQFKTYGYSGVSDNFNNQKGILYNLFVVKKENSLYGVVDKNNKEIISSKYKDMEFNESAREFYVSSTSNKVGIVTEQGSTKINLLYDEINMIDKEIGLYIVKSNSKYGVLGKTGNTVIHLEYDQIGVQTSQFPSNSIKNKYLLFENAIPVYRNKKWGLFDKNGNEIVPIEYDALGYTSGATGNLSGKIVNNVLVIPSQKAIVLGKIFDKTKKYAIFNYKGDELVPCQLDNAYSVTNAGVDTYYMEYEGHTLNIEEYIERVHGSNNDITNNTNTVNRYSK